MFFECIYTSFSEILSLLSKFLLIFAAEMFRLTRILTRTLSFRLSLMVIACLATLLMVALIIMFVFSRRLVKEEALLDASQTLEATVQQIDNILLDVEQASGNVYWKMMTHIDEPGMVEVYTRKLAEINPYISDCRVIWDTDSDAISTNEACWIEPSSENNGVFSFLLPIYKGQQKVGVQKADLSPSLLSKIVLETKPSPNSFCTLLGKTGSFIVYPDSSILNKNVFELANEDPTVADAAESMLAGEKGYKSIKLYGETFYIFYKPFERTIVRGRSMTDLGWSAGIIYPEDDIFGDYNRLLYYVLIIAVVGLMLLLFLCRSFVHHQFLPLRQLGMSAQHVAEGRYDEPIPDSRQQDEVGRLQKHFLQMQQSLATRMGEMQQLSQTLKERGEVLQAAYEQAQGADRMKTNFLYNMSNQMMSPVSGICRSVMALSDSHKELSEEDTNQMVDDIRQQGLKITALLNQLIADSESIMTKG